MTARLHRLDECEKFRKYRAGSMLGPSAPSFDPKKPRMLIAKAIEVENAEKDLDKAVQSGAKDLAGFESRIEKLKKELDELFGVDGNGEDYSAGGCGKCACKSENYGLKAFTRDLRKKFPGLDDIYVWHALCGAWGGVRPGSTHLKSKVVPTDLSPGLAGTMTDLAVVKIIEGVFLAYSSRAPEKCTVNGGKAAFRWSSEDGKLTVDLPWVEELGGVSTVGFTF